MNFRKILFGTGLAMSIGYNLEGSESYSLLSFDDRYKNVDIIKPEEEKVEFDNSFNINYRGNREERKGGRVSFSNSGYFGWDRIDLGYTFRFDKSFSLSDGFTDDLVQTEFRIGFKGEALPEKIEIPGRLDFEVSVNNKGRRRFEFTYNLPF